MSPALRRRSAASAARVETSGQKSVHTHLRCTTVFVVSGDDAIRDSISELVVSAGFCVAGFPSLEAWREHVRSESEGCLVVDVCKHGPRLPQGLCGFESICAERGVVLLVGRGDVSTAVRAIRQGATDALEMPFRDDRLLESIKRAAERRRTFETR